MRSHTRSRPRAHTRVVKRRTRGPRAPMMRVEAADADADAAADYDDEYEFWYDRRHTGALRIVDQRSRRIHGSDPNERTWTVHFERTAHGLQVDFRTKRTHHGAQIMEAVYENGRRVLAWPDRNRWHRIRVDPRIVLSLIPPLASADAEA